MPHGSASRGLEIFDGQIKTHSHVGVRCASDSSSRSLGTVTGMIDSPCAADLAQELQRSIEAVQESMALAELHL